MLSDAVLTEVGDQVGRTASQVALRWHVQRGDIIFAGSMRRERREQNLAIFDLELTDAQMATIDGLDKGEAGRGGPQPNTVDLVRIAA